MKANPLIQKILELFAAAGVAQLAQRFGLNLADALTGNVKFLAHLDVYKRQAGKYEQDDKGT